MEQWERELHTARIVSGRTRIDVGGRRLVLCPPSREARYTAAEIYRDLWQRCHVMGVFTERELLVTLQAKNRWTPDMQKQRDQLAEKIDELKIGLFENWSRSNARSAIRHALDKGREELERLDGIRHGLDHITCEGVAASGRVRFLTGMSLAHADGRPYWEDQADWDRPDDGLEDAIDHLSRSRLSEAEFRELARSDPWRTMWGEKKVCGRGILDVAAVDLADDQRYLLMWSRIYEGIRDHPDAPDDDILDDDDMLDGWMLLQKKRRDAQRSRKRGDEVANEKIRNCDQIFVMAETVEDARKIDRMNDNVAAAIKAQRLAQLKSRGEMHELEFHDTWARMQGEAARLQSERIRSSR